MWPGPQRLVLISLSQIKTEEINSIDVQSQRIPVNQIARSGKSWQVTFVRPPIQRQGKKLTARKKRQCEWSVQSTEEYQMGLLLLGLHYFFSTKWVLILIIISYNSYDYPLNFMCKSKIIPFYKRAAWSMSSADKLMHSVSKRLVFISLFLKLSWLDSSRSTNRYCKKRVFH